LLFAEVPQIFSAQNVLIADSNNALLIMLEGTGNNK